MDLRNIREKILDILHFYLHNLFPVTVFSFLNLFSDIAYASYFQMVVRNFRFFVLRLYNTNIFPYFDVVYLVAKYKRYNNNPVHISLCHIPLSIARTCIICEGLTSKFRDDSRDLMDLRETQTGVAPLDNAVNTKGTRPGVYPCVCTRRAAYVHLTHSLAVSAAMRGLTLPRRHATTSIQAAAMGSGGIDAGGRGWQHKHECKLRASVCVLGTRRT